MILHVAAQPLTRRSHLKYLDLQIGWFSRPLFWVTGTPVYFRVTGTWFTSATDCLNFLKTPVKLVRKVQGLPWKLVEILAVVIILSPISSVCRLQHRHTATHSAEHTAMCTWINQNDTTFKCRNTYDCSWLKIAQDSFTRLYGSAWLTMPYRIPQTVEYGFSRLTMH